MRLKLDENLGGAIAKVLAAAGHDVATVRGQDLCGEQDHAIAAVCRAENRVLVTCDLDFGDPISFPQGRGPGIIIVRLRKGSMGGDLEMAVKVLIVALADQSPDGGLWVVDGQRLRIRRLSLG